MLIHASRKAPRPFRPTLKGGGSKVGKRQFNYPWIIKVVSYGIVARALGSEEALLADRNWLKYFSLDDFRRELDHYLPGVWEFLSFCNPEDKSIEQRIKLTLNRPYKMIYYGTSARGKNHDPFTRASFSPEYWRNHVPPSSELSKIYDRVFRGVQPPVENWLDLIALHLKGKTAAKLVIAATSFSEANKIEEDIS